MTYVDNKEIDFSSQESQTKIVALNNALQDCTGCVEKWHVEQSLVSWYKTFSEWYNASLCDKETAKTSGGVTVTTADFYPCLKQWINDP